MTPHISYAMRNVEATQSLVYFNGPSELKDWTFLAVEWLFVFGFIVTIVHAVRHARESQSPAAIYTLIGALWYGLVMDILSYYTVENFWHGEFSVMLLYNRLPLYIALLYPTFIYHTYMTIRRYDFTPSVEAISVGFFGGLSYLIFDNFGPQVGWWIWDSNDPTTWPYINSVPLTSYHWFFLFTAAFAYLARTFCWEWSNTGKSKTSIYIGLAAIPLLTILLGSLLFIPYNLFSKSMQPWDSLPWEASLTGSSVVHGVSFFIAGCVFVFHYHKPAYQRDRLLMLFPLAYLVGHLYLYIAKFNLFFTVSADGLNAEGLAVGNLVAALIAIVASTALVLISHPVSSYNGNNQQ